VEEGTSYKGKRLFLTKTREESNPELVQKLKRRTSGDSDELSFLVYFTVDKELPLIGGE
jgi:hypothetical protein